MCWYPYFLMRCAGAWRVWGRGDGVERGVGRVASRRVEDVVVVVVLGGGWELGHRLLRDLGVCACIHCYCPAVARDTSDRTVYRARCKQLTARFFNQGQQ